MLFIYSIKKALLLIIIENKLKQNKEVIINIFFCETYLIVFLLLLNTVLI